MGLTFEQFSVLSNIFDSYVYPLLPMSSYKYLDTLEELLSNGLMQEKDNSRRITENGKKALERYRVRSAFILAAGKGERLRPLTLSAPKPMTKVAGMPIIVSQIHALLHAGIKDITIITGYKHQVLHSLLDQFPFLKFVHNDAFDNSNTIVSYSLVADIVRNSYVLEGDTYINSNNVIRPYEYRSCYAGYPVQSTEDWNFTIDTEHRILDMCKDNTRRSYQYIGVSYWSANEAKLLQDHAAEVLADNHLEDRQIFFEKIPLELKKHDYKVYLRQIGDFDAIEIDTIADLQKLNQRLAQRSVAPEPPVGKTIAGDPFLHPKHSHWLCHRQKGPRSVCRFVYRGQI